MQEVSKLCEALKSNTSLTELSLGSHAVAPDTAATLAAMLPVNQGLSSLCLGDSTFGDKGLVALCPGLQASRSLKSLDLELKVWLLIFTH